jgi:hypothetical protein
MGVCLLILESKLVKRMRKISFINNMLVAFLQQVRRLLLH